MLNEEVARYRELSGDTNPKVPISRIGGYLDGYEKALEQKPCEDAIRRQDVFDLAKKGVLISNGNYESVCKAINELPPVNPQPKTGHWINVNEGKWNTIPAYKCSACGANADLRDWSGESPFCPWCGAQMIEPQEREVQDEDSD